jgi:predicted MFS family arabinose efflux permease
MTRKVEQPGRIAARRVILWIALIVCLSLLAMTFGAFRAFDRAIQPETEKRSRLIGVTVRDQFERALELGIPLESMSGVEQFFDHILTDFGDVQSITLLTLRGKIIAEARQDPDPGGTVVSRVANVGKKQSAEFTLPILSRNTLVGEIRIAFDPTFVRTRLQDVLLDVFVFALVSVLLAFELVILVMAGALGKPLDRIFALLNMQAQGVFQNIIPAVDSGYLRRIARRISDRAVDLADRRRDGVRPFRLPQAYFVDIRLSLFIFSLATEISGAFLPLYAREAGGPDWLTPDLAAIAPLIAYLAAIAAVAPFSARITRHVSPRSLFLLCIPLTAGAMVGVGLGPTALWIALWYGAMALVYALATIACQEYAIRTAPRGEMAQAIGSYLFVIMGGAFSGIALGGVLADRIGISATFFFGASLVILAGGLGAMTIASTVGARSDAATDSEKVGSAMDFRFLLNTRFLALVLGVGGTMNIGMSVFVWYLTPVILEADGARIADIGRVMMLFFLIPILVGPYAARLADGWVGYGPMLICGTALSGLALLTLSVWSGFWPMVVVVSTFGIGFAMCDAIQYAHTIRLADASKVAGARDTGLAVLRLSNRLAAIAGLLASAVLAERFDHVSLAVAVGALLLLGMILMLVAEGTQALLRKSRVEDY